MSAASAVFCGVEIPETLIASEMQNHTAASMADARKMAGRALAAKAVLLARAEELGLTATPESNSDGQEETMAEALVRTVLSEEINVDPPQEARVRQVYEDNPSGFNTPPLLEASHILIAPREASPAARDQAKTQAEILMAELKQTPERFERMAANHSACPSAAEAGTLGQLRPGDVLESIWLALDELSVGEIGSAPVETEHGWHILRLDHRAGGARLPFEHVQPHISVQLEARAWTLEAARYVDKLLTASAETPRLKLSDTGDLDTSEGASVKASDLLGAALKDPALALLSLSGDAKAILEAESKRSGEEASQILSQAIGRFMANADDEAWTQIISMLRESETPLYDCLGIIITHQIRPAKAKQTLILTKGGRRANSAEKGHHHGRPD